MFATSKLCVAASHRAYFPRALANLHCSSERDEAEYLDGTLSVVLPARFLRASVIRLAEATQDLRWNKAVPM